MTFKKRAIEVQFSLNGRSFDRAGNDRLNLSDHRVELILENAGGGYAVGFLSLRIYGMKLSDMRTISTDIRKGIKFKGDRVTVSAGDVDGRIHQIFTGTIQSAVIDYAAAPDVAFNINAGSAYIPMFAPSSPNEGDGVVDVADKIKAIAAASGFGFHNNGVTTKLSNQYLPGTAYEQIRTLAAAANIACNFENNTVYIFPNKKSVDSMVVEIGSNQGLIGYPSFIPIGVQIKSEFNPDVMLGRRVNLKTSVDGLSGEWLVQSMRHELSTMVGGGPWFTTSRLTGSGFYAHS